MNLDNLVYIDKLIEKYNIVEIRMKFLEIDIEEYISYDELRYLVRVGNILSLSEKGKNRKRALNIATIIPNIDSSYELIMGCKVILYRLRSFLTLKRIEELYPEVRLTSLSIVDQIRNRYEVLGNTVNVSDEEIVLNNTQLCIHKLLTLKKDISISAPTSAGKSYILTRIIEQVILDTNKCIVYIVPTRALINQVMTDMRECIKNKNIFITSSSDTSKLNRQEIGIFILTQERFYQLCNNKNIEIGTIIIDEAQNIMSDSRGVLLEYSIKYAKHIWKNAKVVFLTPLVDNPEKLLEKFSTENSEAYKSVEMPVRQNIVKLLKIRGGYKVQLNSKTVEEKINIKNGNTIPETIVNVYEKFHNKEKSIIYCNTAEMTHKVCYELYNRKFIEEKGIKELDDFSNFIAQYIHKNFMLVKYIRCGIAFHYGAMPTFIRLGIEELARKGHIDIMVCTSTLLQGVNIPAQNIYIYNPKRSNTHNLSPLEFWNLVGRSGRTGYDLCGNIILIDSIAWKDINKYDNCNMEVRYATELSDSAINEVENAIEFNQYDPKKREFINTIESGIIIDSLLKTDSSENIKTPTTMKYVETVLSNNEELKGLLLKLIGFNVQHINKLWTLFEENDSKIESYILPHPHSESSWIKYMYIYEIINNLLMDGTLFYNQEQVKLEDNKSLIKLLSCSLSWMKGTSIREILFYNFSDFENEKEVTKVVRKQINYIDTNIRYKLVSGIYAYQEILKEYLIKTNREHIINKFSNISTFLELGTSDNICIELISLGLMRELALKVYRNIRADTDNIISELKLLDVTKLNISEYEKIRLIDFIEKL